MWYNMKLCVFRKRGNRSLLLDCSLTKAYLTFQCQPGFLLYAVVNPFVGMADGISMTMLSYICRGCCFVKQKITCQCSLGIHHVLSSFKFMHPSCSTLAIAAKLSEVKCLKSCFSRVVGVHPGVTGVIPFPDFQIQHGESVMWTYPRQQMPPSHRVH